VDEMRERLREKEMQRAEERALAEQEALAEIEARAVRYSSLLPPPRTQIHPRYFFMYVSSLATLCCHAFFVVM
jgi:hypothetical protein